MPKRIANIVLGAWMLATGILVARLANLPIPQWVPAVVIIAAEVVALVKFDAARWISFLAGAYLIAQPFLFDVGSGAAAFNSYTIGLIVMVLAAQATKAASYLEPPTYNQEAYAFQGRGKAYR